MKEKNKKVIILHSHLRPGGVTRIISSQVKALNAVGIKSEILTGETPQDVTPFQVPITVLPEFNYLTEDTPKTEEELNKQLFTIVSYLEKKVSSNDILHVHNLNLGKNPLVTLAVRKLAEKGMKVFNHAHDFAEDRAENYAFLEDIIEVTFNEELKQVLYPDLDNYKFGVLNRLDYNRLIDLGIEENRINFLPNPVTNLEFTPDQDSRVKVCDEFGIDPEKMIFVYPVRVIRRKNIGELILLAYLFRKEAEFIVTLPPQNPVERVPYEKWLDFCNRNIIKNIHFEAGTIFSFDQVMTAADKCITTSVKEGFGMMFLEPWLFNRAVVGRNIYSVTQDFQEAGLDFPCLYNSIKICFEDYETHDFGFLPQEEQMECLEMMMDDRTLEKQVFQANHVLGKITDVILEEEITRNKNIILTDYSLDKYGAELNEIYTEFD